jgi:2-polyprenyl-3-methyl-5-hydroxy-6-metoxy-1,4-benzoquinol methylase
MNFSGDHKYTESVRNYDKIYAFKDYKAEVERLIAVIRENLRLEGKRLLDVACGTGLHLEHLKEQFEVEGLDVSEEMLELACQRNPGVMFHQGDMVDFSLGRAFDVVTCLFSSIGYVKTVENLGRAISCMVRHMIPGGILVLEPWFTPEDWCSNTVYASFIDEPDLKIARINTSLAEGRLPYFDMHYLIGTPEGTTHFVEHHELGLFEPDEMTAAFNAAGLEVRYDPEGLTGRGLYIGLKKG